MTEQEAINVMEKYTDETLSKVVIEAHNMAISALEEIQQYREFEERLKKIYGDCPGLVELVINHLEAHEGVNLPEPIFKARLLTDGKVDEWEAYKQLGTVEELREAMEKQRAKKPKLSQLSTRRKKLYICPTCSNQCLSREANERQDNMYCWNCGQAIDWE